MSASRRLQTGDERDLTASDAGQTYRDSAGWTIVIPPSWHVLPFSDTEDSITTAGVQLSNVSLPPPSLIPGYPIQVRFLPEHGISLTIAADLHPDPDLGAVAVPPLPYPDRWLKGSALRAPGGGGSPHIETLSFRFGSTTFAACAKIGPRVTSADLEALAAAIRSLR